MRNKYVIVRAGIYALMLAAAPLTAAATSNEVSDFIADVNQHGGIVNDMSASSKIKLGEPQFAYVNISGIDDMPQSKTEEHNAWLEFSDGEGNYFRKRIITSAQGSSSLGYPKKNIKFDLCEDEWIGDETTDVTFGDWVKQDGFHLKAYYIDYFRGVGAVSYKIFDDIIADRGDKAHPWQRAEVADADGKALCHPEGFPAAVYLNGDFYGLYAFQLKKHRRNMGMDKNAATHIHLDGEVTTVSLFNGNIDWSKFEIRNPKGLVCMDGSKYDGDNPGEIIDATSAAYDPSDENHVRTAQVKKYIKKLSKYCAEVSGIANRGGSTARVRAEFAKRFDVDGFIDYTVFSSVTNNVDGWWKNWQWLTYDGVRWFVEPYDLDMTFGNVSFGTFVSPPEYNWYYSDPNQRFRLDVGPAWFINEYYADDLDSRYASLRDTGTITVGRIYAKVEEWYNRVGPDMYAREYARWPGSMCNRDMIVADNWEWTGTWQGFQGYTDWTAGRRYKAGTICRANNMLFRATGTSQGVYPVIQAGYRDGLDRISDWISKRIALEDRMWNYTPASIDDIAADTDACDGQTVYNLQGMAVRVNVATEDALSDLPAGIYIVNGKKYLVK
ncbi:MAG: CotH kinase family protein [Muribaculaceae bacterium]|nr:CotH kinase family protein [Muribaculaceae bacterium]